MGERCPSCGRNSIVFRGKVAYVPTEAVCTAGCGKVAEVRGMEWIVVPVVQAITQRVKA